MKETLLKQILVVGLSLTLVGCVSQPVKPTKPMLEIELREDGGMCLDRSNTAKLGTYILELERQ